MIVKTSVFLFLLLVLMAGTACGGTCGESSPRPKITVTTRANNNYFTTVGMMYEALCVDYGKNVTVSCSSAGNSKLRMRNDGKYLPTDVLNSTTIGFTEKLKVGEYRFTCSDNWMGCKDTLTVLILPVLDVFSARSDYIIDAYGQRAYFVPIGDEYVVTCRAHEGESLQLRGFNTETTDISNVTMIRHRIQADQVEGLYFSCVPNNTLDHVPLSFLPSAAVTVDYYPEVQHFRCVLYDWSKLECWWNSSSARNTLQLFYKDLENGKTTFLTADYSGETTGKCVWRNKFKGFPLIYKNHDFSFVMQSCNEILCDTQTGQVNSNSITKLVAIEDFEVLNTSSHDAILMWSEPEYYHHECEICTYKLEYRLRAFGEKWRKANTSSVECGGGDCGFILTLPYPESRYEARVYVRLEQATDDRLWSEPTYVFIVTKPSVNECVCTDPQEPSPITSSEASCEACKLSKHVIEENMALSKKKIGLKQKRDKLDRRTKALNDFLSK